MFILSQRQFADWTAAGWDDGLMASDIWEGAMSQAMKILRNAHRSIRSIAHRLRTLRNPILARPISALSDDEIDNALERAGLTRKDLFTPKNAIAQHRTMMAGMLATLGINVEQTVRDRWVNLKEADHICSRCTQTGRCHRWLEWGRPNTGPEVFCPNATLFNEIVADQTESRLRDNM